MTRFYFETGAAFAALLLIGGCAAASRDSTATAQPKGAALASADIPRPPAIPEDATEAQAAPLNEAGEIASEISANTMIEEVPVNGGLAWREDGQVVRTASNDGQRIAYFRAGQSRPFFVQRGGLAYAYENGRPALAYDSQGRPVPVGATARAAAQQLADQSGRERAAAAQAPAESPAHQ